MKPFNLEEAKAGKPICTRSGKAVRIVCFDRHDQVYPIIALVKTNISDNYEDLVVYTKEGKYTSDPNADLMMAPEKKEGWINIYRNDYEYYSGASIFKTKEDAICKANCKVDPNYITTTKIEWEE